MKGIYLFSIIVLGFVLTTNAQTLISVQNGGTPKFYTQLEDAVSNAQNGDTIYIPGGNFISQIISKRLHFIGVGINPDSTSVTNRTIIGGYILKIGSEGGSITGCYINSTFSIAENIDQYTITRCFLNGGINFASIASHFIITQNVIKGFGDGCLYGGYHSIALKGTNHLIANNIILADISSQGGNIFRNNDFLYYAQWCGPLSSQNDEFYNNIILGSGQGTSGCIAKNNLGYFNNGIDSRNNQCINNYTLGSIPMNELFVSFSPSIAWSFNSDLHLRPNSPFYNAGTDGTDIGIYGGAYPWKEGSIPFNPHFQSIQISPKTDNNGNLNVKVKVAAQDN